MQRKSYYFITLGVVTLLIVGAVLSWVAITNGLLARIQQLENRVQQALQATTSTHDAAIVSVERRMQLPLYPSVFAGRGVSPVIPLVRKIFGKDGVLSPEDQTIGDAVALTSDGWLATPSATFKGNRPKDFGVLWNGRVLNIKTAVQDLATDVTFLKVDVNGLPQATLLSVNDVSAGLGVWVETRAGRLNATLVSDVRLEKGAEFLSSEHLNRRFLVSEEPISSVSGGAVWDGAGQLVGLLESSTLHGWRVIPAGFLSHGLAALSAGKDIRYPLLGIKTVGLADVAFEQSILPLQGAWIKNISVHSPAHGLFLEGDVIERVERDILDENADLGERLMDYAPGTSITFFIERAGTVKQINITLGSWVASQSIK